MIVDLFSTLTRALEGSFGLALMAAMTWGFLSILLSPCHLSSIPLIIGFLNTQANVSVRKSFRLSLVFALGILVTIAGIGLITAALGRLLGDIGTTGNYVVAAVFIATGLYLLDILRLPWLRIGIQSTAQRGTVAALILGLLLGIGLGPCTFAYLAPLLVVVFQVASANIPKAAILLAAFGIGHCAVIVAGGTFTTRVQHYLDWTGSSRMVIYLKRLCGVMVVLAGLYLIFAI
ncbi:MAG: cytochrome C biogenesis protein [Fidelibacterota bacterium]|nr:MAG: cytochrome C biogenesis protein [Candidatus Neomarinimicrobiota bacterium]